LAPLGRQLRIPAALLYYMGAKLWWEERHKINRDTIKIQE